MQHGPFYSALLTAGLAAFFCAACSDGERSRNIPLEPDPSVQPVSGGRVRLEPTRVVALDGSMPAQSELVGVAVAANGDRYVLDAGSGLYRLGARGAERVLDSQKLDARYGLSPDLELTDVVAYGTDRFLITAENDGFLLDLWAGTMQSYFCYLPPVNPSGEAPIEREPAVPVSISQVLVAQGVPVKQRTESVAVNPVSGEIFALPQTVRLDTGTASEQVPGALDAIAGSELFIFGAAGGQPSFVQQVDTKFLAGGMVVSDARLFLGAGDTLLEMRPGLGLSRVAGFPLGTVVTGMALDVDGSLLVLDGPARRLLSFDSALP